jgi:hypothetical protein
MTASLEPSLGIGSIFGGGAIGAPIYRSHTIGNAEGALIGVRRRPGRMADRAR